MRVFLIGDSIRINSERFVVENLNGDFQISSPRFNCESSQEVRKKLDNWLFNESPNLVHVNCGLHDVRYDPGTTYPLSSKEQYSKNLISIFQRLSVLDATIIWATSTPVDENIHNEVKASKRYIEDIAEYNKISVSLSQQYGFEINDLFSKIVELDMSDIFLADGIHFNEKGNGIIGDFISNAIKEAAKS
ncbi:MAG: SGNH/GDSL hydrolase family protein [Pseudomonadales bacterium]|nr:SGNH/GDSL hydrolase family protein [Pseudomonadales bacterium]